MSAAAEVNARPLESETICNQILQDVLKLMNRRYFSDNIVASVVWEVPRGTVSMFIGERGIALQPGSPLHSTFERATRLLQSGQHSNAIPYLKECANADHPESKLLLSHLYKRAGDSLWQHYAAAYNRHIESVRAVPAACYYRDQAIIAIHPHLSQLPTPLFVFKYLVYHECCHQLIDSTGEDPHPPAFLEWEDKAPGRIRALDWLEKRGFPTLRTAERN